MKFIRMTLLVSSQLGHQVKLIGITLKYGSEINKKIEFVSRKRNVIRIT